MLKRQMTANVLIPPVLLYPCTLPVPMHSGMAFLRRILAFPLPAPDFLTTNLDCISVYCICSNE